MRAIDYGGWKRRRTGVRVNGGMLSHCLGQQFERQNLITNKIQLGLRRLPSDDGELNNQPKIDGRESGDERMFHRG